MRRLNVIGLAVVLLLSTISGAHAGSVGGQVTCDAYNGVGSIYVAAYDGPDLTTATEVANYIIPDLNASNTFVIANLTENSNPYLFAYWDQNENSQLDSGEFIGTFFGNPAWVNGDANQGYMINLAVQRGDGFTVGGQVTNSLTLTGSEQGPIFIVAYDGDDPNTANVLGSTNVWPGSFPQTYSLPSLAGNTNDTVYVLAYWDISNRYWPTGPGPKPGDYLSSTQSFSLAGTHSGIDLELNAVQPSGTVSGTVTSGGKPLPEIQVRFYAEKGNWDSWLGSTYTASDGTYSMDLDGGVVYVNVCARCAGQNFTDDFYDGAGGTSNFWAAADVTVTLGQDTPNIDFDLEEGPKRIAWFGVVTYTGDVEAEFMVPPAFRDMVTSASVETPGRGTVNYNLDLMSEGGDRLYWDSPCRSIDLWIARMGALVEPTDYGTYTLTVNFSDGQQVVQTSTLNAGIVKPVVDGSFSVAVNADGSANVNWTEDPTAPAGQSYQVRVREQDTGRER